MIFRLIEVDADFEFHLNSGKVDADDTKCVGIAAFSACGTSLIMMTVSKIIHSYVNINFIHLLINTCTLQTC
jgi:hypothetical protein